MVCLRNICVNTVHKGDDDDDDDDDNKNNNNNNINEAMQHITGARRPLAQGDTLIFTIQQPTLSLNISVECEYLSVLLSGSYTRYPMWTAQWTTNAVL